ncbi:MAG: hypothetical protein ACLPPF_03945 [Rhodomicrobium sp.]
MGGFRNLIGGILLGLALAGFAASGPASAKETVLTEDSVSRFLASFAEMRVLAIGEGLRTGMDPQAQKNPLGAVLKAIRKTKLKAEAEKIAVAHGFASLPDWARTGGAIAQAYLYVTVGPARGIARDTLEQNKDSAIKQLEKLGILTESSKQKLKENLDSLEDRLSREPPAENTAVVKKMKPDIDAAVNIGLN